MGDGRQRGAWWRGWFGRALDVVYPGACHLCREAVAGGRSLCESCAGGLPGLGEPFCQVCGEGFDGRIDTLFCCPNCRDQHFAFEFARPAVIRSPGAMELVRDFKYGRRIELGRELAWLARRAFDDPRLGGPLAEHWPLVPVPLHPRRQRWRQFNQAEEIARPLGRWLGLEVVAALRRVRPTVTQTRLTRSQRQRNLRGAFAPGGKEVRGPGAILVDDVFTTGATVHECARVLRRGGVQKVVVVTVMRG